MTDTERLAELREVVIRATAELRHIYRHAYLARSSLSKHDDGILSWVIRYLEKATTPQVKP